MSEGARLVGASAVPLVAVLAATPLAIRVARRIGFHDCPSGYKRHAGPTPYLGGAAVLLGFLGGAIPFAGGLSRFLPVLACAVALWAVGTLDDRRTVPPLRRVGAEVLAAAALWASGLGWTLFDSGVPDLVLTVVWVVGVVNAFNLMDNMDGAAGTVAAVSAAGTAGLALVGGDPVLAGLALAMGGACAGFLRYNLAAPAARIFLGDGGSMPIGLVVATAVMALPFQEELGWPTVLLGVLLVGLPVLDTTLVSLSRWRRGVPLWLGARDHLTHHLRESLPSARAIAGVLMLGQAALCGLAVVTHELGRSSVISAAAVCVVLGGLAVGALEFSPASMLRRESPS